MNVNSVFGTGVIRKTIALAAIMATGIMPVVKAEAQSTFTLLNDQTDDTTVSLTDNGKDYSGQSVGRYKGTIGNGPTINVWCSDLTHNIDFGGSYLANIDHHVSDASGALTAGYYAGGLSSALRNGDYVSVANKPTSAGATVRANEAAFLIDSFTNSTNVTFSKSLIDSNLKDNLAAVQLSIWDIVQDGGDGLMAGSFQAKGESDNLLGLVNYYENLAGRNSTYTSKTTTWIQAPVDDNGGHLQDFATSSVPEPGPLALIAGLITSGSGLAFRRRNRMAKA